MSSNVDIELPKRGPNRLPAGPPFNIERVRFRSIEHRLELGGVELVTDDPMIDG